MAWSGLSTRDLQPQGPGSPASAGPWGAGLLAAAGSPVRLSGPETWEVASMSSPGPCRPGDPEPRDPPAPSTAPGRGWCSTWGTGHFSTFDGHAYDFEGTCNYIFAAICKDASSPTFSVQLRRGPGGDISRVIVELGAAVVTVQQGAISIKDVGSVRDQGRGWERGPREWPGRRAAADRSPLQSRQPALHQQRAADHPLRPERAAGGQAAGAGAGGAVGPRRPPHGEDAVGAAPAAGVGGQSWGLPLRGGSGPVP